MSKEQLERRSLPDLYPKEQSEITERKRVEEVLLSRERELTDAVKLPSD